MSRFHLLLNLTQELADHPEYNTRLKSLLRRPYPMIRLQTPFGFVLQGQSNNAVLAAFTEPDLYEPFTSFMTVVAAHLGGTYFDIGANIGYFSLLAVSSGGLPITAHAFEPMPDNYSLLQKNIALNKASSQITPYRIGLSDGEGEREISVYGTGSSFVRGWDGGRGDNAGFVTVQTARLDAVFTPHHLIPPIVVKIDVEGFEEEVLRGGEQFFRAENVALVLLEVAHEPHPEGRNPHAVQTLQRMADYGFRCYGVDGSRPAHQDLDTLTLIPFEEVDPEPIEEWPICWICLRPGGLVEKVFLKAVDLYPLFRHTYHADTATLDAFLREVRSDNRPDG